MKAHAFQNGNKRTAYTAALTFLDMNGVVIARPSKSLEDATVQAATGEIGEFKLAGILRSLGRRDD